MRIGILGAGQLGRMLALAGYPLGHSFLLYNFNGSASPGAGDVIDDTEQAYLDEFIAQVDVVTYELEHIPLNLVEEIAKHVEVLPNIEALALGKDRVKEKTLFVDLGIPTARFFVVTNQQEMDEAVESLGGMAIAKTATGGYDGKGQLLIQSPADLHGAWEKLGSQRLIVEQKIEFDREISIIACRGKDGDTGFYSPAENTHQNGILKFSIAPAPELTNKLTEEAQAHISKLLERLDYVGVLALELFVSAEGLIANEIAPRVHNSGHWTMDGAVTSQFENHIRAVAGQPLGNTGTQASSCMLNIIGTYGDFNDLLRAPDASCYHYGKSERPGRKLGHVNIVTESYDRLTESVEKCLAEAKRPNDLELFKSKLHSRKT